MTLATDLSSIAPLRLQRRPAPAGPAAADGLQPLGLLGYAWPPRAGDGAVDGIDVALLGAPASGAVDAWCSRAPMRQGVSSGGVRWRCNDDWLWGAVEVDDGGCGMQAQAYAAYRSLFAALRETGFAHLQRLWNYLPRINADGGGLERYRQFNAGRQQAFFEAEQAAFEGSPAACAMGTAGGPLCLRFLAGRRAPLAIENPRQTPAYRYPRDYGPTPPSFSRAALLDAGGGQVALLISGTASIVGHTSRHPADVREQLRETLRNLEAVIGAAHARTSARFSVAALEGVVYLRHADDAGAVREELAAALGRDCATLGAAVFAQADICRGDLLVEIEAHAFAGGALQRA